MKKGRALGVFLLIFSVVAPLDAQQGAALGTDIDALNATEVFRIGLEAYNRASFNEAILALEQALSYKPGEGLILDWLGKAYYRSGMEEIALRQWQAALRTYPPASPEAVILGSRIERVSSRRSLFPAINEAPRYVETGVFPGKYDNITVFRQPSSILPCDDGSVWVVAYGSNEIVRLDVNGYAYIRRRGPISGFDRPYDIARGLDGRLYVTEFRGGRISILSESGDWLSYIGKKGFAEGDLSGPAAIACDEQGYIYVVEFGNRRISKFSPEGGFLLSFGRRDALFPGFLSPTGIAVKNGIVYAADSIAKKIYTFDGNGLYLGAVIDQGLTAPESLRALPGGGILIADTNRLLLADGATGIARPLTAPGNSRIRYTGAGLDRNGAILATNFNENEIAVLAQAADVAAGFFVQIERVASDGFPQVQLEVSVQDAHRRPIIGLDYGNFFLSERGRPVNEQRLIAAANNEVNAELTVLIEKSPESLAMRNDFVSALTDIQSAFASGGGRIASIVSAGTQPVRERFNAAVPSSLGTAVYSTAHNAAWRFDLGLRLAASSLLQLSKKRAIVFLSSGELGEMAFEQYALSELAAFMANNNILFYCVLTEQKPPSDAIRYLCEETGGETLYLYRPQGIGATIKSIAQTPSGVYLFSYKSALQTDFGRAFLPISVEVRLLERSGRDDCGYFPPLE